MANGHAQHFKGHRWFAAMYDRLMRGSERKFLAKHRPHIVGDASGQVLEVGAGTGASFPYYEKAEKVIATEPDPFMLERARRRLQELGLAHVDLAQHPAEELPFDDHSFDHVVSSLVFCTVSDPRRSLSEVKRVLKPGGTFRFIEHVRFDSGLRGSIQDFITPVWSWVGAGCHPNRRTLESIGEAGFDVQEVQRYDMNAFSPVVVGVARPR